MKKYIFLLSAASILGLASCSDDSSKTTTTSTSGSDTAMHTTTTPAMDTTNGTTTSTTTTTTKTTTTVTTRNLENRSLMTVKSNKPIKLVYNPNKHYYVDAVTNQQPTVMYYYDPSTNDTFDYRGFIVNNALMNNNGTWKEDETKIMDNPYNVQLNDSIHLITSTPSTGKMKIKQDKDSYKEKTDTSKIKVTDKMMKVKTK